MPGSRIAVDGLLRCLCPSIDELLLPRALSSANPLRWAPRCRPTRRPNDCTSKWPARSLQGLHTTARRRNTARIDPHAFIEELRSGAPEPGPGPAPNAPTIDPSITGEALLSGTSRELLHLAPTTVIYDALRAMLVQDKKRGKIRAFVKYLVERRAQTPNAMLYEALITSNWDLYGSAEEVREILDEMRTMGVGGTSSLYHAALRALAVHPDYILRNRIISEMKERWLDITVDGKCSIVLGLLRDGQHEMALDNLEQMMDEGLELPAWLHDIFVFVLAQHGFLDEAIALLQRLHQFKTQNLPANVWYFVLDECSRQYHYEGTKLAWDTVVQPKILVPSDGTCLNVLNTASRYSDAKLATDVIRHLSARNVKLAAHHYEALVDCYANRNDVENALQALCIMARAAGGLGGGGGAQQPCRASTHSVSLAFRRSASLARVGRDALLRLAETYTVPLAAFNVVVEGLCAGGDDGEAFELYQQIRHLCGCGPDFDTFRPLMERSWDQAAARFLVDEMQAFGVRPTREFYDRLVYLCATGGNLDGAFVALDELKRTFVPGVLPRPGQWVRKETALAVVRRCVAERDERLWNLLSFARRIGLDLGSAGRALAESAVSTRIGEGVVKEGERRVVGKQTQEGEGSSMPWLDGELSVEEKMKAGARG